MSGVTTKISQWAVPATCYAVPYRASINIPAWGIPSSPHEKRAPDRSPMDQNLDVTFTDPAFLAGTVRSGLTRPLAVGTFSSKDEILLDVVLVLLLDARRVAPRLSLTRSHLLPASSSLSQPHS